MAVSNYGASGSPRSWRAQKQARASSPAQRWIRRVLFTVLGVGLLVLLVWWLMPVRGTRTHLAYVRVDYTDLEVPPTAFGEQDFRFLDDQLRHTLCAEASRPCPTRLTNPQGAASIETLAAELRGLVPEGEQDVLICYLKFQGVSDSGKPYVLNSDFDARLPSAGRAELGHVLRSVSRVPTKATLLVLDSGQVTSDVRLGMLVNEFARLVIDEVGGLDKGNLWVLSSHRLLERSHVSNAQRRSLLAHALAEGLSASADGFGERNQPDGEIDLKELYEYVSDRVASSAQRTYARSQQPLLLRAGVGVAEPERQFLARVVQRPKPAAEGESAQVAEAADSDAPQERNGTEPDEAPSTETGATALAPADSKAVSAAEKVNAGDGAEEAKPSTEDRVLALLQRAWSLRDAAEDRSSMHRSPIDDAPHAWRRAVTMLLYYEQLYRVGNALEVNTEDLEQGIRILESLVRGTARSRPSAGRGLLAESLDRVYGAVEAAPRVQQPRSFAMTRLGRGAESSGQIKQRSALQMQYEQWLAAGAAEMPVAEHAESAGAAAANEQDGPGEASQGESAGGQEGDAEAAKPQAVVRFRDWAQQAAARDSELVELRFAAKLADLSERMAWEVLAEALQVRYQAEEAAAVALVCTPWVRNLVDAGDRRREAVERELFVAASASENRLRSEFQQAGAIYEQALDVARVVRDATGLAKDLVFRAPDYVRWHAAANWERSSRQPTQEQLHDLFERLSRLLAQLEDPQGSNIESIRRFASELSALRERIERSTEIDGLLGRLDEPGAVRDAEDLLSTALLSGPQRRRLLEALPQFSADPIDVEPIASAPEADLADEDWDRLLGRAALELKLVELARVSEAVAAGARAALTASLDEVRRQFEDFQSAVGSSANGEQRWTTCRALGAALADCYRQLPAEIRQDAESLAELSDPESRSARRKRLARLALSMAQIDARDGLQLGFTGANPIVQVYDAQLYDLLLWHQRRLLPPPEAQRCPAQTELEFLVASAGAYLRQAQSVARQPEPGRSAVAERYFDVSAESQVPLAGAAASLASLQMTARDNFTGRRQAWIVLHYDHDVLSVASDEMIVYEGRTELDVLGSAPSLTLLPGESRVIPLSVSAAPDVAREQARLTVRVVFDGPYLVHETVEIDVALPVVDLVVRATVPGTVRESEVETGTMILRPFPNVATAYQFGVVNRSGSAKKIRVELTALPAPPEGQRAWFTLPVDGEGTWQLAGAQPKPIPLAESQFELAPDARPVWLKLAAPAAPAAPPANAPSSTAPQEAASTDVTNRLPIRYGMLCVIRPEGGEGLVKHIRIEPMHPIEYLESRARFSLDDERIDVEVKPIDRERLRMPPNGSQVEWRFRDDDPIEPDAPRLPFGEVTQQQNARLDLVTAEDATKTVLVRLTVDGYPRAFVHPVNCGAQRDVPPATNRREIRILEPVDGAAFRAPRDAIRVALEVDAPLGAFQTPGNRVEIGIDSNRNRQLDPGEAEHRLFFDRQVGVFLDDIADDGFFNIRPTVQDFELDVSIPRVTNRRVPLLAQLVVDGTLRRSEPVEIVLDGAAPQIGSLAVDPPAGVRQGNPLHVTAVVNDGDTRGGASGIENVHFAFGLPNAEFDDGKAVPGARLPDGRWSATLETKQLQAGRPYHVLVRARDNVGILSALARTGVISIRPPPRKPIVEEPAEEVPKLYTIAGTVSYGEPIARAEVELFEMPEEGDPKSIDQASTDAAGKFIFGKRVGPGKYSVVAAASVKNRRRRGEQTISLQGGSPEVSVPIKLQ